jgi:hypothetical protein
LSVFVGLFSVFVLTVQRYEKYRYDPRKIWKKFLWKNPEKEFEKVSGSGIDPIWIADGDETRVHEPIPLMPTDVHGSRSDWDRSRRAKKTESLSTMSPRLLWIQMGSIASQ